jgi:DNA-binding MarR family transcriptional regulator
MLAAMKSRRSDPDPPHASPTPPASEDSDIALGAVLDFMRALWAVDHGLQTASKRMEQTLGVTGPQRLVVRIVGRQPGISAGHLAEIMHVHPSTLTGILGRLEKGGFIQRRSDPGDRRRALFTLTARGRALDKARAETVEARVRRALVRLPDDRVGATREVLTTLVEELAKPR